MTYFQPSKKDSPGAGLAKRLPQTAPNPSQRVTDASRAAARLLNVEEAAAILSLKPATLYTWVSVRRYATTRPAQPTYLKPHRETKNREESCHTCGYRRAALEARVRAMISTAVIRSGQRSTRQTP